MYRATLPTYLYTNKLLPPPPPPRVHAIEPNYINLKISRQKMSARFDTTCIWSVYYLYMACIWLVYYLYMVCIEFAIYVIASRFDTRARVIGTYLCTYCVLLCNRHTARAHVQPSLGYTQMRYTSSRTLSHIWWHIKQVFFFYYEK